MGSARGSENFSPEEWDIRKRMARPRTEASKLRSGVWERRAGQEAGLVGIGVAGQDDRALLDIGLPYSEWGQRCTDTLAGMLGSRAPG